MTGGYWASIPHGTFSGYNHHRCRCSQCRLFVSAKRAHPRPKVPIPHGTYSGYNYHGCRCELCLAKIMGARREAQRNP